MERPTESIVLKNGARLLSHKVFEEEKSVEITFNFDRPVAKEELQELRLLGQYKIIQKVLEQKGWITTEGEESKSLIHHQLSLGYKNNGKTWIFRFHTPDAAPKGEFLH